MTDSKTVEAHNAATVWASGAFTFLGAMQNERYTNIMF